MIQVNTLLELRNRMKDKKPDFVRQDTHKRKKLEIKWKKPQGIHSKIRHRFKGRGKMPSPGYKSPVEARGVHTSGLRMINVYSIRDLEKINKENQGIIVAKSVGMKKKLDIFMKAKELNINVLNVNIDEQIKKIQDFMDSKKKDETKESKETKEKKEIKEKEQVTDEQKKEMIKKEKDKVLTKRL